MQVEGLGVSGSGAGPGDRGGHREGGTGAENHGSLRCGQERETPDILRTRKQEMMTKG